jgi:glycosyltransferase involved in cell wall biosynthesis
MRVTFILPGHTYSPGGGARIAHEYASYLVRHNHSVNLVCPYLIDPPSTSPRQRALHFFNWAQARLSASVRQRVGRSALRWMKIDPRVNFIFVPGLDARFVPDADAVFATYWRTAEYVDTYPPSKGEKFYLIQSYETWGGPKGRVDATWRAPMHKVVIANWLGRLGRSLGAESLRRIPNALDHSVFHVTTPISSRQPSILALNSPAPIKGTADAVAVLRRVHERYPAVRVSMFGVGVRGKNIPDWIAYYRNPRPEVLANKIYNSHAIYICASHMEGWPLPPAEAMACGCTVATTDVGGVGEYALHEKTALVAPVGDCDSMFHNLCKLIEDDCLRMRLSEAGTAHIRQFTWEKSGRLLEQYLNEVVLESQPQFNCSSMQNVTIAEPDSCDAASWR